jgi:hypothetical protein
MIIGELDDEVTQRGIWRHWKKVMQQGTGAAQTSRRRPRSIVAGKRG